MRTAVACVIALCIWLCVLGEMTSALLGSMRPPAPPAPLDMRLVVIDQAPTREAPAAPAMPAPHTTGEKPQPLERKLPHAAIHRAVPRSVAKPDAKAAPDDTGTPREQDAQTTRQPSTNPPAMHAGSDAAQASSEKHETPDAARAAATGTVAARSISQPLPALPDDLREQAYQTVAIARFRIHTDGSADVELIRPTPYPRLNQILLETLRQWRFFPALQDGRPIESTQDIRVHFTVS
ncbi:hypothetical protein BZM27_30260 [Paraburkholderia steynii]|uniref:TonB C-terminal domain-containing protein n=1 Tax=Paraburkholderia steynii TaxID=1245441 RepID=A0A4R0XB61_9BURK|nr:hypothetical protein BZM27_30260 [Paraburkholderia steynii]